MKGMSEDGDKGELQQQEREGELERVISKP
jgi:hypothetical protein